MAKQRLTKLAKNEIDALIEITGIYALALFGDLDEQTVAREVMRARNMHLIGAPHIAMEMIY